MSIALDPARLCICRGSEGGDQRFRTRDWRLEIAHFVDLFSCSLILSSWLLVLGSQCLALGSLVLGSWFSCSDALKQ
jgi:hypothetical protein